MYCVWLHALLSFSCLLLCGILLFKVFLHTKKKEPSPRETSFSDTGSHHACILLCYSKACTTKVTMSNPHGSWQKDPVLPFVSCSACLLHYNCEHQKASMCSCLVSRGFPSVPPIFFRISSTAFSKEARSCSRVRMDCFSLPSLVNRSSTVASRFWIFPLATFQSKKKEGGGGRKGRKNKKEIH